MAAVPVCVSLIRSLSLSSKYSLPKWTRYGRFSLRSSSSTASVSENKNSEESTAPSSSEIESELHRNFEKEKKDYEEKLNELNDKYKRSLAETENVRQRMQRQIADAKLFGIQGFCKDLLEVADILQKATETVPADELSDKNPHLKSLFNGLCMTESQLQKVFRTHGVSQINPVGEKFNPNMHEALFEQFVEGKEPGTVAVVTKVGYKLHDRTIRPALVGVVKSPS